MDDLGRMMGGLGGPGGTDPATALRGATQAVEQAGGIDAVLAQLRDGGLGDQVDSWVSTRPTNRSIRSTGCGARARHRPADVGRFGLDIATLLPLLAGFLPQLVDMLTPEGRPRGRDRGGGGMPDLGGLLGGLGGRPSPVPGRVATGADDDDLLGGLGGLLGGDQDR